MSSTPFRSTITRSTMSRVGGRGERRGRRRQTLALPAGEADAAGTEPRVVLPRQVKDHLVNAGALRGVDDLLRRGVAETGDILAHGAGEQTDILRQIADMAAKFERVPVRVVEPAEAQSPPGRRNRADEHPSQRALAGATPPGRRKPPRGARDPTSCRRSPSPRRCQAPGRLPARTTGP